MGCDIHLYIEVKQSDGSWGAFAPEQFVNRSYDLFAILANVCNGRGFAGVKTGDGFNPISEPKGIPDNASPEYKELCDDWGPDAHSHSHLTLAELLAFDWEQTTRHVSSSTDVTYKDCTEHFWETVMPRLLALGDPESVRICFFFDN